MSSLSSKYWFDKRKPRLTQRIKESYELSFDVLNLPRLVVNSAIDCDCATQSSGIYFVMDRATKGFIYIGSSQNILSRLSTHIKKRKFNKNDVSVGWILSPNNKSLRRVEESYIYRYQPKLNTAAKSDSFREDYTFCWCGELIYSHDLCLLHFEEFAANGGCLLPEGNGIARCSISDIDKGVVVALVHGNKSVTINRNKRVFAKYPLAASKYLSYLSSGFKPGQVQANKVSDHTIVCNAMILSKRFGFTPWFEHAQESDYQYLHDVLVKASGIAKTRGLPVYIPHGMGQEYGMCWHFTKNIMQEVFDQSRVTAYT